MEVYNELGSGFLEPVYQEAFALEFGQRNIPFEAQRPLSIRYKHHVLQKMYTPDFITFGAVIVEIKALANLTSREESQLLNYLKAAGLEVGVLLNFGSARKMEWKRMIWRPEANQTSARTGGLSR